MRSGGVSRRRRCVIVGVKFGELYLNAFLHEQPGIELAGILARGSPHARRLATAFGVPLHTSPDTLPDDIEIACIVVRGGVAGGDGTALATALLQRGVHVVQEHPLHPDELSRLQDVAARHGRVHWVNSFYAHTEAGRRWIAAARTLRERTSVAPAFAHAVTSRQLLYSTLDLLLLATGADTAQVLANDDDHDAAFGTLRLTMPGVTAWLRLQRHADIDDPDLHSLVMHQMTLGWPSGHLSLAGSFGPVLWSPAPHDPGHRDAARGLCAGDAAYLDMPPVATLHPAPASWREAFELEGPGGVVHLLSALRDHLDGAAVPPALRPDHQANVARLWQQVLRTAGHVREERLSAPPVIDITSLMGHR